jgi:mono/diheme cytochrome c family protein
MLIRFGLTLLTFAVCAPAALAQTPEPDPAKLFRAHCLSCHQPPDLNLAIDRAWLDQIKRTA